MRGLPRTFWYLWVGALIDRLGTFVYTFLALYLTRERHFSVAHAGFVVALWGAGNFAAGPVGGYFADHLGRRRTMLGAFVLSAAAMMNLGLARTDWHIAVATLLLGLCGNLYRPAMHATVADVVPPADRTRAYGYLYWAVNLGFAGAAMLGGFMAERNFMLLFAADAVTTVLFGVVVYLRVPETHPERDVAVRARPDLRVPLRDRPFVIFVFAQLLVMLVGSQGNSTLPIDLRDHGIAPSTYGWLLAINGVMIVLLQPKAVSLVQRYRPRARARARRAPARRRIRPDLRRPLRRMVRVHHRVWTDRRAVLLAGVAGGRQRPGADASARHLPGRLLDGVGRGQLLRAALRLARARPSDRWRCGRAASPSASSAAAMPPAAWRRVHAARVHRDARR